MKRREFISSANQVGKARKMEPVEVNVDEDGKVTVSIDLKNGKRGELELPFDLAKDLLMKLRSRLESFENRRGWR